MPISEIKGKALKHLAGQWGKPVAVCLISLLLNYILVIGIEIYLSGGLDSWYNQDFLPVHVRSISFIMQLALVPITVGETWFFLKFLRKKEPHIKDIFEPFHDINLTFKLIGTELVRTIFVLLWSLLLIIPGIIKSFSYSQVWFLLKDHPEWTITEALAESDRRMKGLKGKYFLLQLSFIGWHILSFLTFSIGYIWLQPYISSSSAIFYEEYIAD